MSRVNNKKISNPFYLRCFRKIIVASLLPITVLLPLATSVSAGYVDSSNIKGITPMFRNDEDDWRGGGGYIPVSDSSELSNTSNSFNDHISEALLGVNQEVDEVNEIITTPSLYTAQKRLDELRARLKKLFDDINSFYGKLRSISHLKEYDQYYEKSQQWYSAYFEVEYRVDKLELKLKLYIIEETSDS